MATFTLLKTTPYTAIENVVITEYLPQIGAYGFTVYAVIKSYRNQQSGTCFPSYATIAERAGMDRVTVIRYVKLLKSLNLLMPEGRLKEDGSPATNQYHFSSAPAASPSAKKSAAADKPLAPEPVTPDEMASGSDREPPPVVAEHNHPSCSEIPTGSCTRQPEQSSLLNKKERTRETPIVPTAKQKTCPHPPSEIAVLPDNIRICNHCFALLDENLTLANTTVPQPPESAVPECEHSVPTEGEATTGRDNYGNHGMGTAPEMACKSRQIASDEGKTGRWANSLVALRKLILGALKAF